MGRKRGALPELPSPGVAFEPGFASRLLQLVGALASAAERREGAGRARLAGAGEEFVGYRPYRAGEDASRIDQDLLARLDRPFVRVARREAREHWLVLLDTSASMGVGRPGKLQRAAEVAAGIAAVGAQSGARVRINAGDGRVFELRRRAELGECLRFLASLVAHGERGLAALLDPTRVRDAARVFALGDLLDVEPADLLRLARRGRELFAVRVLAPDELAPRGLGSTVLVDAESGERRSLAIDAELCGRYERRLEALLSSWSATCARHRAHHAVRSSAAPFEELVRELFAP
jgi:uncharacterized protein (DUF58 family)